MSAKSARPKIAKAVRPSQHLAEKLREARESRRWSQSDLADALTKAGWPIDRTVIAKIEAGGKRTANVSVDEALAIAAVLGMSPLHLIVPWDDDVMVAVLPTTPAAAQFVRSWMRGETPLHFTTMEDSRSRPDDRFFFYMQPLPSRPFVQLPPEHGRSGSFAGEFGRQTAQSTTRATKTQSRARRRKA